MTGSELWNGRSLRVLFVAGLLIFGISACSDDEEASDDQAGDGAQDGEAVSETLDLSTPEGALLANRKIQCSLEDGNPRPWLVDTCPLG